MTVSTFAAALLLLTQSGKGSIEGSVLSNANKPIAGAQVTLTKRPGTGVLTGTVAGGAAGVLIARLGPASNGLTATTDAAGHFVFSDVDAGDYLVQASADGYARQEFGPPAPGQTGMSTSVSVSAGQTANGVVLHLTVAGNVSGRVTGSGGEPLANMQVMLVRAAYSIYGQRTMGQVGTSQTNDKGEYRLFWAPPGRYYVVVGAPARPIPPIGIPGSSTVKYPQTYYPDVRDISAAAQIDVTPGGELNGIDFRLTQEPTFLVRGRVIDSTTGQPPHSASISIVPVEQMVGGIFSSSNPFNPGDGTFELRDVFPGSYWVRAQLTLVRPPAAGAISGPVRQPMGLAQVTVSGNDVENVAVTIYPPFSIPGRIRIDGAAQTIPSNLRVSLQPATTGVLLGGLPQATTINSDGTFMIENVLPGEYRATVPSAILQVAPNVAGGVPAGLPAPPPVNFYLKEARLGTTDLLTETLAVSGPVSGEMQIVLGTDSGTLTGTVTDARSQASPQTQVILVPSQRDRRDLYKIGGTDASGHFAVRGVPPGSYRAFAIEAQSMLTFFDPAVLQKLEAAGIPVNVGSSATLNVDLKLIITTR